MSHCEKKKKRQKDLEEDHIKYLALKSIVIEIKYSMEELSSWLNTLKKKLWIKPKQVEGRIE